MVKLSGLSLQAVRCTLQDSLDLDESNFRIKSEGRKFALKRIEEQMSPRFQVGQLVYTFFGDKINLSTIERIVGRDIFLDDGMRYSYEYVFPTLKELKERFNSELARCAEEHSQYD